MKRIFCYVDGIITTQKQLYKLFDYIRDNYIHNSFELRIDNGNYSNFDGYVSTITDIRCIASKCHYSVDYEIEFTNFSDKITSINYLYQ